MQNSIFRMAIAGSIVARLMSFADKIIVQTYVGAEEFPRYLRNKVSVIVGYRPGAGFPDETKNSKDSVCRFAYTGAISWSKGIGHLLDAFVEVSKRLDANKDIELHLYGSGEKELVDKCNSLDKVFYHGRVDNSVLRKDLSSYDVFIFPSLHDSEGHPGSVIEALMAALPVIASNWSGINEVIRNNENGLLVEPGDTQELADAIEKLIKDVELRNQLAKQALESSREFDAAHVLPRLAEAVGIKISYDYA
ncbi:MAG: glycosyltransferase [Desulfobacteraceae bacterium]|nr:glycosyltransferase [Desulfobacteraceae bacterium]